jgi:hypothetical protein
LLFSTDLNVLNQRAEKVMRAVALVKSEGRLTNLNKIITDAENYLGLGTKRLENVIQGGSVGNPFTGIPSTPAHADYIDLEGFSLEDLVYTNKENDKLMDVRANGIDIFDTDPATGNITGLNLDKIENYAKALDRLGLTDFDQTTINARLGTQKLSNIPVGKTLSDLISDSQ